MVLFFQWIALSNSNRSSSAGRTRLDMCYSLLPSAEHISSTGGERVTKSLQLTILGQALDFYPVCKAIATQSIVPVLEPKSGTSEVLFKSGNESIWLPAPLTKSIPSEMLFKWLGKHPLASSELGSSYWHPLWLSSVSIPSLELLTSRKRFFNYVADFDVNSDEYLMFSLKIMSSFAECAELRQPLPLGNKDFDVKSVQGKPSEQFIDADLISVSMCDGILPPLSAWPVFATNTGTTATCTDLAYPDAAEFGQLPVEIAKILRPGVIAAVIAKLKDSKVENPSLSSDRSWRQNKERNVRNVYVDMLDVRILETIAAGDSWISSKGSEFVTERRKVLVGAKKSLELLELVNKDRVVGVVGAAHALLHEYASLSNKGNLDITVMQNIIKLTNWAMRANAAPLISHYLVLKPPSKQSPHPTDETKPKAVLAPVGKCYLHSAINVTQRLDNNFSSFDDHICYVATSLYTDEGVELDENFEKFIIKCGVQTSLSLVGQCRQLRDVEKRYLPDGRTLPTLRHTNTSSDLYLPFGFGVFNRKKHVVLDADFTPEWIRVLDSAGNGDIDAALFIAAALSKVLCAVDSASVATPHGSPYVAKLLQPNSNPVSAPKTERKKYNNRVHSTESRLSFVNDGDTPHSAVLYPDHRIPPSTDLFPPPLFSRLYYLPPGQPGISC